MEINSLTQLTKLYDIQVIEKHLVFHFLNCNSISYEGSSFISEYLYGFTPNKKLLYSIQSLQHDSIEEIAVDMELLISSEDRKVNGAFFTPSYIADYIITTIHPDKNAKIIDLSCGSGAFLLAIVRYMTKTYNKTICECIKENVYGADILEYNITRCRLLLSLMALSNNEVISIADMNLICCDSLKHKWTMKFDAVVGNPPYVKFQDMDDDTRSFLLSSYETTKFGTYNLYFAFFELGLEVLNQNGKLGYITPNNYFTSLAGESLRCYFQKKQCIYQIVDFNATKVFEVQTYTAITFLNKEKNSAIKYGRIGRSAVPQYFLNNVELTENKYSELNKKKWRLLCGNERDNISIIEKCGESIGTLFNICVGIATLKDEVYSIIPTRQDANYFYINREGKEYQIEKRITRPLVKISEMKKPEDIKSNTRHIIFPYFLCNGKATAISEDIMSKDYPYCYEYLLAVKSILEGRGKGKHIYTPWYAYGRTQGLNRTGVKLLTPTFSKVPRFLLDENEDGFFTNGYGVYMREETQHGLFDTDKIASPENFDVIQKILNSKIMEYYVDKTSVAIEGGYPCYQKNFIERFSIPSFSQEEIENLRNLSDKEDIDKFLIDKYHLNLS